MAAKKTFFQNITTEAINPFFSEPQEVSAAEKDISKEFWIDPSILENGVQDEPVEEKPQTEGRYAPFKPIIPPPFTEEPPVAAKSEKEIRSRRVQLVLKPSDFEALETIAHTRRQSVNGLINELIADLIDEEQENIKLYNSMFAKR